MHSPLATACLALLGVLPAAAQSLPELPMPRGFRALEMPADFGGRALAGSLVQISPQRGFRYLGHLSDCGLPNQALAVLPSLGPDAQVSNRKLNVDISIGAKILQFFSVDVDADKVSRMQVTLGPVVDEMVIPIAVVSAARANSTVLRQRCGDFLKERNVFWVNNALKAEGLTIQLLDEAGAAISASAAELKGVASDVSASTAVRIGTGGVLVVDKPVYIAFRDAPPFELLTGDVSLFSVDENVESPMLVYGDEIFQ